MLKPGTSRNAPEAESRNIRRSRFAKASGSRNVAKSEVNWKLVLTAAVQAADDSARTAPDGRVIEERPKRVF